MASGITVDNVAEKKHLLVSLGLNFRNLKMENVFTSKMMIIA